MIQLLIVQVLGHGIYSAGEAAELTQVSARRILAWMTGWDKSKPSAVARPDYARSATPNALSFLDLIDVLVVGQLRVAGVSLPTIRRAYLAISKELETTHPFGRQELFADSKGSLFVYASDVAGDASLIEIFGRQSAFPEIMLKYLKRIDFDPQSRLAMRLKLNDHVVVDPRQRFGKPIVASCATPTRLLFDAFIANNMDAEAVADWHGVAVAEVIAAVQFEQERRRKAA